MIVEDEPATAKGLALMIDQIDPEYTVIGLCRSGEECQEMLCRELPDVMFVDINMPGMNGLDMIREVKKTVKSIRFVILTGYAKFEYAQEALKLGVQDYILKPISFSAMEKVLTEYRKEYNEKIHHDQQEYVFRCITFNEEQNEELNPLKGYVIVFFVVYSGPVFKDDGKTAVKLMEQRGELPEKSRMQNPDSENDYLFSMGRIHNNTVIYALICHGDIPDGKTEAVGRKILSYYHEENRYTNLVISRPIKNGKNMKKALCDAEQSGWYLCRMGESKIVFAQEKWTVPSVSSETRRICGLFSQKRIVHQNTLDHFFALLTKNWKRENPVYTDLSMDIRYVFHQILRWDKSMSIVFKDAENMIIDCCTYDALERCLREEAGRILGVEGETSNTYRRELAESVKEWIDENYTTSFTYKIFPALFNYNEKYISGVFKEKYQMTPNQYVENLRLKMARELIFDNPDILIADVAGITGFSDPCYFSHFFKREAGISPSEYKKQIKEQKQDGDQCYFLKEERTYDL